MIGAALRMVAPSALTDNELIHRMMGPRMSKHRQYDQDGKRIPGKCIIAENYSIKKRMRWARREA